MRFLIELIYLSLEYIFSKDFQMVCMFKFICQSNRLFKGTIFTKLTSHFDPRLQLTHVPIMVQIKYGTSIVIVYKYIYRFLTSPKIISSLGDISLCLFHPTRPGSRRENG